MKRRGLLKGLLAAPLAILVGKTAVKAEPTAVPIEQYERQLGRAGVSSYAMVVSDGCGHLYTSDGRYISMGGVTWRREDTFTIGESSRG